MSSESLPGIPTAADFRALASSSPWRFTTLHLTHRCQQDNGSTPIGGPVEVWLDRGTGRLTVRSGAGVETAEGVPYGTAVSLVSCNDHDHDHDDDGAVCAVQPSPDTGVVLRPDGLVAQRPEGWHYDHGDPMWRDYQFTAMLDPAELSQGIEVSDVAATVLGGRPTWSATCRPLLEEDEEGGGGYDPRCGCCPLLLSPASLIPEYGPEDPALTTGEVPTVYCVHLDVQTGVVVDITALDGIGGSSLTNEIHAVDEPLDPPL
ncbi:hypothetical protein [Kocuria kalidii]|uniref:hypothetical protein n=1 Tax=Kocuria kalidii TaxID=3376283 RepID=UPI0037ABE192